MSSNSDYEYKWSGILAYKINVYQRESLLCVCSPPCMTVFCLSEFSEQSAVGAIIWNVYHCILRYPTKKVTLLTFPFEELTSLCVIIMCFFFLLVTTYNTNSMGRGREKSKWKLPYSRHRTSREERT